MAAETTPIAQTPAADKAAQRMLNAGVSIRAAFESLNLDWTFEDVQAWLERTPAHTGQRLPIWDEIPSDLHGQLIGMFMAWGIILVERDREQRFILP